MRVMHAVVIAGGGPTGLMLAGELALAGIDVAIVERRATQDLAGSRARGIHTRTLEVLDQRGIAERFISQGQLHKFVHFHIPLDISDLPSRHNYSLGLGQQQIERTLADWVSELRVPIYRAREVIGFKQDDAGVDIELSDSSHEPHRLQVDSRSLSTDEPTSLRAQYLVGCDGGRSLIRKTAGIEFPGWDATTSWLIAEAEMSQEPSLGFRHDAIGIHAIGKLDDGKRVGLVLAEAQIGADSEPTLNDVSEALIAVYGTDFGIHNPTWISRFNDMTRQAASYRSGRILLAGDAAHVHPPLGGQGLNMGVQDAVNLGWKLAQVIKQTSPPSLLDTYHTERHAVAARVLRNTMAHVAVRRQDERSKALGDYVAEILTLDEPRKRMAAEMCGLGIRYDLPCSGQEKKHPLLGRRMPDLDLVTSDGPRRVFTLLHAARPLLLNFDPSGSLNIAAWADRVQLVDATYAGTWELPGLGMVVAPAAVLIRPDGYVAWVGDGTQKGLEDTLSTWFGSPTTV